MYLPPSLDPRTKSPGHPQQCQDEYLMAETGRGRRKYSSRSDLSELTLSDDVHQETTHAERSGRFNS